MNTAMLGLLAETPVHSGTGRGIGVVDLPVAREASTDYPVLVGSSLKGALRDKTATILADDSDHLFGTQNRAGELVVSDGRILLLPVRSLTTSFRWVTCPHLLERYRRDLRRAGLGPRPDVPAVGRGDAVTAGKDRVFLEERQFTIRDTPNDDLLKTIAPCVLHDETRCRLRERVAILNDDDFAWFVRYGLCIQARNVLDDDGSKRSRNLWYEETLPPDTVMYTIVMGRTNGVLGVLDNLFPADSPYLQVGGNETVGQGWFAVSVRRSGTGGGQT